MKKLWSKQNWAAKFEEVAKIRNLQMVKTVRISGLQAENKMNKNKKKNSLKH